MTEDVNDRLRRLMGVGAAEGKKRNRGGSGRGSMRCPGCNRFPSFDTSAEPEASLDTCEVDEINEEGEEKEYRASVGGTVRIVLASECCGEECKEYTFDVDLVDIEVKKAEGCTCGVPDPKNPEEVLVQWWEQPEAEAEGPAMTERQETSTPFTYKVGPKKGQTIQKPIPYRFQKKYYGAEMEVVIRCGCGHEIGRENWSDETQASSMEELT